MATSACGIQCDVCRLHVLGSCSTCGSGRSLEGRKKAAAQIKILGAPCPILACALEREIEYCLRDCEDFPCGHFRGGPYPFSQGFLTMQERRLNHERVAKTPSGERLKVPAEYWEDLRDRDVKALAEGALAEVSSTGAVVMPFFGQYLLVDGESRSISRGSHGRWERVEDPLLELLALIYLLHAGPWPLRGQLVTVQELRSAHFFRGPHELKTRPVALRYGTDLDGFRRAAEGLGGERLDMADAAYRFFPFPRTPVLYLLWKGDEEFPANVSVLFDRSIEQHLPADAIWGLVNLTTGLLVKGADRGKPPVGS